MCQEEGKELEAVCGLQRTEQTDILYLTHRKLIRLENLRGNSWFSVLVQGKANHQGSITPDSQRLTAFITSWALYE